MYVDTNYTVERGGDLQSSIAKANGFTQEELAKNREGVIADSQVGRLMGWAIVPLKKAVGALFLWLLFAMVINYGLSYLPGILAMYLRSKILAGSLMITVGAFIALMGGFFQSVKSVISVVLDATQAGAVCLEGRVCTSRSAENNIGMAAVNNENNESYNYVVKEQYLPVTYQAYEALRLNSGSSFKVYIAPRSKFLLSMEPTAVRKA